ncbi:MAG: hypothetical protein MI919_15845 [Holophagales bacterium]|nr:hypothetical protein [Holophagales bacterium]
MFRPLLHPRSAGLLVLLPCALCALSPTPATAGAGDSPAAAEPVPGEASPGETSPGEASPGEASPGEAGPAYRGRFVWEDGGREYPGEVTASFAPAGDDRYEVVFRFRWRGEAYEWYGSLVGSLEGGLEGEIRSSPDREPSFRLRGAFEEGVFTGTHYRIESEDEDRFTGTLTLDP